MLVDIDERRMQSMLEAADTIYALFAFAQGQEDSYKARREEWAYLRDEYSPFPRTLAGIVETKKPDAILAPSTAAETVFLEFTPKELSKMPKFFRTVYKLKGGKAAHIRLRENGTYEIRYRRDGINLSVSAKVLEVAKERFIQALASAKAETFNDRVTFEQFAMQWLEVVKKPQIKANTWETYRWTLQSYVFPRFGKLRLKDIKPTDVQKLLNAMEAKNIKRGAQGVYVLLKPIFEFAIAEELIPRSPMRLIQKPKFEVKHGQALTVDEERDFVEKCIASDCPYRYYLILLLYTGIRRSELFSVEVTPQWITVTTSKTRKGESQKKRRIPVSPMLKPFLPFLKMDRLPSDPDELSRAFKKFAPERHLHELRHTFITRCQECGVSRELTSLWAGHKADNTMTSNVYTHFSEEFQLGEIQKLRY